MARITQKISYTNKVALNTNSNVADVNKVNADDMNEIKEVVNFNADELEPAINTDDFFDLVTLNETPANVTFRKIGKVVTINYQGENKSHSAGDLLFTLPSGYYPTTQSSGANNFYFFPFVQNANIYGNVLLRANDGRVSINQISSSATGRIYLSMVFIVD